MALQFTRDVQVAIKLGSDIWEVPVLDGFSFSQAINSSEITVSEAGATSRRGRLLFNDSLAPVEWSFSTYARPTLDTAPSPDQARCIEEALWAMYTGATSFVTGDGVFSGSIGAANAVSATTNTFDLTNSDIPSMGEGYEIYFMFKPTGGVNQVYKITKAAVNSVTIDFDIDGIATIQWSGFGSELSDEGTTLAVPTITTGLESTSNFIRNRISTVELLRTDKLIGSPDTDIVTGVTVNGINASGQAVLNVLGDISELKVGDTILVAGVVTSSQTVVSVLAQAITLSGFLDGASSGDEAVVVTSAVSDRYVIVLTGGSINFENNISYLTPEELGVVNSPLGNITGTRSISGNLTCYLDNDTTNSKSGELFADLVSDNDTVRNAFALDINIGGASAPALKFSLPTAHLEIPVVNVEDLLTLDIAFHGQASGGNIDAQNEATIVYTAA